MSAWPEAVWITNQVKDIFKITEQIAANNAAIADINDKIDTIETSQESLLEVLQNEEDIAALTTQLTDVSSRMATLEANINGIPAQLTSLLEQLNTAQATDFSSIETSINTYISTINSKQLVIVESQAENGTSENPMPAQSGNSTDLLTHHAVFLVVSGSD